MSLNDTVIENIKKYRKVCGLSQEKLAELCGTSTSYIGLLETYKKSPRLDTIERIANALEIEPVLLFEKKKSSNDINDPEIKEMLINDFKNVLDKYK
ncbi:MAG: helix-turn-helix transcriptional regulator [Spirochaetales bacterium]|nr:helix-turn-helix transcriptional regulator [Spirochaetales bacterium]